MKPDVIIEVLPPSSYRKEMQSKTFCGDKDTQTENDRDDDENTELGAVEALTRLRPHRALVVSPAGGNRVAKERFMKNECELSLRPPHVRRGIRSVRSATFGSHSDHGSSPHNSGTSCKKAPTDKHKQKISSRKIQEFYDPCHDSVGQTTRATPDFLPTKSLTQSRRKRKLIELGEVTCQDALDKSDNSKPVRSNTVVKRPTDMKGRWASERYKSAQLKLIDIMHQRGAAPGHPILRPALREEARKYIGDTGLLDHLLKHMTDTVVASGERFRRRHNAGGAMEYWLEDADFMEIRKAAKIEDPSWIPPPGWKPSDGLPGSGEYGYRWSNPGMTPVEVTELKKLKEAVDKVRSDVQSLSSQVRISRSQGNMTAGLKEGSEEDKHETTEKNEFQGGRSTCKTLEAKSQLEMDLSGLQKSLTIIQEYVQFTMMGLGFSRREQKKLTTKAINGGVAESSSLSTRQLSSPCTASARVGSARIDLDTTDCFARTSSPAYNRISSEEINGSKCREVDSSIAFGSEPSGLSLSLSSLGVNRATQNELKASNAPTCRFLRPGGMIISRRGAFSAWSEGVTPPETPPATNTLPLYLAAATSHDDGSPRILQSTMRSTITINAHQFFDIT